MDAAYQLAEEQKQKVDPMYHDKIDYLADLYARKLAENINQAHAIDARVPSILIAGGGNFPVQKKHKQNAARDRHMGEYQQLARIHILRCRRLLTSPPTVLPTHSHNKR